MNKRDELQKLYDLLEEKIIRFREERIISADALIRFQLDKKIEEAEAERSEILQQIENADTVAGSEELYRALMKLGYREQVRSFLRFLKAQSVGAFLIHGSPDYGQRWLLNRLVTQYVRFGTIGKAVKVKLDRIGRRRDINVLWRELGGLVGLSKHGSPEEIAKQVFQLWKTQTVLLVFHDVDCMPKDYLQELLNEFWFPLASQARGVVSQTHQFQLLMFLVDYEGCVGCKDTMFVEQLAPSWEPKIPIRLPEITAFCDRILLDWLETVEIDSHKLPFIELMHEMEDLARDILRNSENGIPELALSEICNLCGCNWYDERERWLKY
ncbi:MAG: hypothetical protein SAK29_06020 [Scytonema sp. PMC 1069.18]|nr:hypothetical protein [Scytonema sp. PMC 1069.18]MEC4881733.1 hypothetical protein [Scytonema sp. PMC 1070.18]